MKKAFPYIIIALLLVAFWFFYKSTKEKVSKLQESELSLIEENKKSLELIKELQGTMILQNDSLREKDSIIAKNKAELERLRKERDSILKPIHNLPPDEQVKMFNSLTGSSSEASLQSDTSMLSPIARVATANEIMTSEHCLQKENELLNETLEETGQAYKISLNLNSEYETVLSYERDINKNLHSIIAIKENENAACHTKIKRLRVGNISLTIVSTLAIIKAAFF